MTITDQEAELLRMMTRNEELVWEGRNVYVGLSRTSHQMVYRMLARNFLRHIETSGGGQSLDIDYYTIGPEGIEALDAYDKGEDLA